MQIVSRSSSALVWASSCILVALLKPWTGKKSTSHSSLTGRRRPPTVAFSDTMMILYGWNAQKFFLYDLVTVFENCAGSFQAFVTSISRDSSTIHSQGIISPSRAIVSILDTLWTFSLAIDGINLWTLNNW